jgi:tRNA (cmo5U34)-methyltransferase
MLSAAAERLRSFGPRVTLRPFRLEQPERWCAALTRPIRCFVSSLVVHHLPDKQKELLYQRLYHTLEPGGGLLLIDLVLPTSPRASAALGINWDAVVREQSLTITGSLDAYRRFVERGWNYYTDPDPLDQPTSLFRQLGWLAATGFRDVDCFWQRAGHALFGGYK